MIVLYRFVKFEFMNGILYLKRGDRRLECPKSGEPCSSNCVFFELDKPGNKDFICFRCEAYGKEITIRKTKEVVEILTKYHETIERKDIKDEEVSDPL